MKDKRNLEGAMRILEALSGAEEELLERSEGTAPGKKSKIRRFYPRAWAAVLVLAVAGALSWGGYQLTLRVNDNAGSSGGNGMAADMEEYAIALSGEEGAETGEETPVGAVQEGGEAAEGTADAGPMQSDRNGQDTADTAVNPGDMAGGGGDAFASGKGTEAEGAQEAPNESDSKLQAKEESGKSEAEGAQQGAAEGNLDSDGCPRVNMEEYTLEEAESQEILGDYIPVEIPQGYVFEKAGRNLDREEENLTVTWSRGMDYIMWTVLQSGEVPETVDVEKTESYDERLYEIPYAETVPEEYRQSMDNPVFAWEEFSLDTVRSRMVQREDSGDTDTPRGNFCVLYPDGVLIRFSGRGTPEEIWEMFVSMKSVSDS